jgi:nitrite reductase/ring-hydroxylating ferredoxin subunit
MLMQHELIKTADIPEIGSVVVPFFGREVHVFRTRGGFRAVANTCLHFGGPLECKGGELVCPWHGARFDMESGERTAGPARRDARLMVLSTRVENGALNYVWGE